MSHHYLKFHPTKLSCIDKVNLNTRSTSPACTPKEPLLMAGPYGQLAGGNGPSGPFC